MGRKKRKKPQQDTLSMIVLVTALIELVKAIIELLGRLNE